jgi:hypothetical protein
LRCLQTVQARVMVGRMSVVAMEVPSCAQREPRSYRATSGRAE